MEFLFSLKVKRELMGKLSEVKRAAAVGSEISTFKNIKAKTRWLFCRGTYSLKTWNRKHLVPFQISNLEFYKILLKCQDPEIIIATELGSNTGCAKHWDQGATKDVCLTHSHKNGEWDKKKAKATMKHMWPDIKSQCWEPELEGPKE